MKACFRTEVLTVFSSSLLKPKICNLASASSDESPLADVRSCSKTSSRGNRSCYIWNDLNAVENEFLNVVAQMQLMKTYQINAISIEILRIQQWFVQIFSHDSSFKSCSQ